VHDVSSTGWAHGISDNPDTVRIFLDGVAPVAQRPLNLIRMEVDKTMWTFHVFAFLLPQRARAAFRARSRRAFAGIDRDALRAWRLRSFAERFRARACPPCRPVSWKYTSTSGGSFFLGLRCPAIREIVARATAGSTLGADA
jgi:hypothetical protein